MVQHKRKKKIKSLDILPIQSLLTLNNNEMTNFATLEGLKNSIMGCL